MINKIRIENVKGYDVQGKDLNVNLDPTKINLCVAANGFGKSSLATAFESLKKRHSLQKCRLCRLFLSIGDFSGPDEVPVDDDGLLFRPCAGDLLRLEDFDPLHERPDDLCGQFRDVRVFPHHADEGIHIQLLYFGDPCYERISASYARFVRLKNNQEFLNKYQNENSDLKSPKS